MAHIPYIIHSIADTMINISPLPHTSTGSSVFQIVLNIVFGTFGVIALLMITIAGFQFVVSSGEPQKVERAKNTIIYALIGLVVCIFALAIVNFVIGAL